MQSKIILIIFLIKICNCSIFEVKLDCDCEYKSSICYSSKIISRIIDESTIFINKYCSLSNIDEVQLSWLTKGIQRELHEFPNLKFLKITNSHLNSISFLENSPELKTLDIPGNAIKDVPILRGQIDRLFINKNKIEILRKINFKNLRKLEFLNVEENEIFYIAEDTFSENLKLRIINLNRNNLTFLELKTFHKNLNLKEIHLNWNQIKNLKSEHFLKNLNLEKVRLRGNKLRVVSKNWFYKNLKLKWFDLAENKIFLIEPRSFENLDFVNLTFNLCINEEFFVKSKKILHMNKLINRNCNIFYTMQQSQEK
ncbi:hypothetical protein ACKWTF_016473 [Chironomus riparius]